MATTKKRINISVSKGVEKALTALAKRDKVPAATKAAELVEFALEVEEDYLLGKLAESRDTPNAKFVSHSEAWKHILSSTKSK